MVLVPLSKLLWRRIWSLFCLVSSALVQAGCSPCFVWSCQGQLVWRLWKSELGTMVELELQKIEELARLVLHVLCIGSMWFWAMESAVFFGKSACILYSRWHSVLTEWLDTWVMVSVVILWQRTHLLMKQSCCGSLRRARAQEERWSHDEHSRIWVWVLCWV